MKRHFKSALALFMPLLVVSCLTISSALILSSSTSTAIDSKTVTTSVEVLESCSMTSLPAVNPETGKVEHSFSMVGGTAENNIAETTRDSTCNDYNG